MNQSSSILDELNQAKTDFYAENGGKNKIFKKEQKLQLARSISENFVLQRLLSESMYLVPGTNHVYIRYEIIKHYATLDIVDELYNYITSIYDECIVKYGGFYIDSDLNTISISGVERLKPFILAICEKFNREAEQKGFYYANYIINMNFYYVPSFANSLVQMLRPYMSKGNLSEKLTFYSKQESPELLRKLLGQ